jgi:hypothetical protein
MLSPWHPDGIGLSNESVPREMVTGCGPPGDPQYAQFGPPPLGSYGPLWGPIYAAQRLREVVFRMETAAIFGRTLATNVALAAAFPLVLAVSCARGYARYGLEDAARQALRRGLLYGRLMLDSAAISHPPSAALVWELHGDVQLAADDCAGAVGSFSQAESLYRLPDSIDFGLVDGQEQDLGDMLEMLYGGRYPVYGPFEWPEGSHVERIAAKVAAARDGGLSEVALAVFTPRADGPSDWREPFRLALVDSPTWWNASQLFDLETDGSPEQGRIRGRWRITAGRSLGVPTLAAVSGSMAGPKVVAEGATMALLGILDLQDADEEDLAEAESAILMADCRAYVRQTDTDSAAMSPVHESLADCLLATGDYAAATAQYDKARSVYEQQAVNYSLADSNLMILDRLAAELLGDDGFRGGERGVIARVAAKREWCAERN